MPSPLLCDHCSSHSTCTGCGYCSPLSACPGERVALHPKLEPRHRERYKSFFRNFKASGGYLCERAILGVALRADAFGSAPYKVLMPNHRFFNNSVELNELIGKRGVNYKANEESDEYRGGASGGEMDTSIKGRVTDAVTLVGKEYLEDGGHPTGDDDRGDPPPWVQLLARGANHRYGADMTYYHTDAGGFVFATGSINFCGSLVICPKLTLLIKNVLDECLRPRVSAEPTVAPDGAGRHGNSEV